jgi:hypothetical protein
MKKLFYFGFLGLLLIQTALSKFETYDHSKRPEFSLVEAVNLAAKHLKEILDKEGFKDREFYALNASIGDKDGSSWYISFGTRDSGKWVFHIDSNQDECWYQHYSMNEGNRSGKLPSKVKLSPLGSPREN